jgi:adenine-specific DNA-methyltransferase
MSRKNKNDHLSRFQELLQEIFQFDFADLDTGIYRLFRLREKELRRFIEDVLPAEVDAAFGADTSGQRQLAQEKVDELADRLREELADDAVQPNGNLSAEYKKTKLGKQYQAARKALDDISASESDRDEVFNHLYTFFSRYYEDADFIPKRRYSRRPDTYAVPYSGEEVMFHWATRGMHYIKTGEHFRDYRFKVDTLEGACNTHFRLTEADIPRDNTKGDRRWFFPLPKGIEWDEATRTLTLPFHYRLPTEKEAAEHGKNSKAQRSVLAAAEKKILGKVAKDAPFLQAKLAEAVENAEDSYLLRRMGHFARRHSADYFIYPELKAFLERELEFYVKDQMLHLDDLEGDLDTRLRLIRLVRGIAEKIIEFLDAIEQLQNRLFEKPKFVLATDWLLHIRHVPEKLWPAILKNKVQKVAWRELFSTPAKVDKRFLKTHPTLVLDTQHFDAVFKRRLLEQLPYPLKRLASWVIFRTIM